MLDHATSRALPVLNRIPDVTPAAQACCGVCRTCTTTNVLTLTGTAIVGAAYWMARRFRPFTKSA
jgi:hypothetical protein